MWMWMLLILVCVVAFVVGYWSQSKPEPKPEPKTFGLEEARAARKFIQTSEQAKAVKAVVLGVLGYEDTVAEEVDIEAYELKEAKDANINRIISFKDKIRDLEAYIADIRAANDGIDAETANLAMLRAMFV